MNFRTWIFCLFALTFSFNAFCQESQLGNWAIYIGSKQMNNRWNFHHEIQYRNYNAAGDLEQLLLRGGIGYNLTEGNNNLLVGYAFIRSENYIAGQDDKAIVNESRIYQQFITKQKIGKVGVQHRYRYEQRFIEGGLFRTRFRYFTAVSVPLLKMQKDDQLLYLSAYNEIFIHTKNTIFDRNRLYGGLGFVLNKHLKLELGYMNQFLNNGKNRDQINIFAFANF